jgi:copper(I)-binding protein
LTVTVPGRVRVARRVGIGLVGVLLTASCAAGQHAQTAEVVPAIDGTHGTIGKVVLDGVSIRPPTGSSYAAGSTVQLSMTLVNNGAEPDTLVNVTSPAFTGWGIVDNADAASATASSGADTGLTIDAGAAQRLSLAGGGVSSQASPRTLVLTGLASKSAPLFPGNSVDLTFRFANAGTTTLHVPVQLTPTPNDATLPAQTGASVD